ncbi:hypothetical protein QAD02_007887 [Eretmocerus hayati]|uniref:Uncharacterized protein n=1 Tax=Eretmocerus hayati TaxID=131215 RepID=A0ACC2N9A7_9HYME|nr:hypothetical protein QAD02_007887 [Eretmocerus hayati]
MKDKLHKTCLTLEGLVGQLIDYSLSSEEELNSAIISEVLKKQFSPRIPNPPFQKEQATQVKRVHFAPQSSEIASILSDNSKLQNLLDSRKNFMEILKEDLGACLERLKSDSTKISNTSSSDFESWSTGVRNGMIC